MLNITAECFSIALVIFQGWNIQLKDVETSLLIKNEAKTSTKKSLISVFDVWQHGLAANL